MVTAIDLGGASGETTTVRQGDRAAVLPDPVFSAVADATRGTSAQPSDVLYSDSMQSVAEASADYTESFTGSASNFGEGANLVPGTGGSNGSGGLSLGLLAVAGGAALLLMGGL